MLGFKRKADLADRIGCSRQQLSRWFGMKVPPRHMHKGFDKSMCRALEIDRHTLFYAWHKHDPHEVPRAKIAPIGDVPYMRPSEGAKMMRQTVSAMLYLATEETLMKIARVVRQMIDDQDAPPDQD